MPGPAPAPDRSRAAPPRSAAEILRRSPHHEAFLRLTAETRGIEPARALLAAEWRYLGPLLEGRPHPRVLDLACGAGGQSLAWAERGARVVGLDIDQELLELGRSRAAAPEAVEAWKRAGGERPEWTRGDATRLPFRDGSFDVAFCTSLLEHVPDWHAVLGEVSRILRAGGVAVVYTTNRHCPIQGEVNHFPFYSWLPEAIKRRVMAWIMEHRRDLVNYTDFPAINWFTYPGLRRSFSAFGLEPHDRIDLGAADLAGLKGAVARAMRAWPLLKAGYYLGSSSASLYGVKR